ncbi:MAG: endolytic transglycosylase MltG, partial [Xanthomonadales bacterium]|nr:endolytic transglycosylase MltG [Xanthomonadales bacterium]
MSKNNAQSKDKPRSRWRWFKLLLLLIVIGAAAAGWKIYQHYQRFLATPLATGNAEPTLVVAAGDSFDDVLKKIRGIGLREGDDLEWQFLAFQLRVTTRLQVGEYALGHGLTPAGLLRKLASGKVIQHRFTIVEGWTFRQLRAALAADPTVVQTLEGVDDAEVMRRLDAEGVFPEGRFLPETYHYTKGVDDLRLLKRGYLAMQELLKEEWPKRAPDLPLANPDEALTLASIIEKETGMAGERPQIAGVFIRRLKLGMLLQTDPTVIYGIGDAYNGNITRTHLRTDTPYNTYTRAGL